MKIKVKNVFFNYIIQLTKLIPEFIQKLYQNQHLQIFMKRNFLQINQQLGQDRSFAKLHSPLRSGDSSSIINTVHTNFAMTDINQQQVIRQKMNKQLERNKLMQTFAKNVGRSNKIQNLTKEQSLIKNPIKSKIKDLNQIQAIKGPNILSLVSSWLLSPSNLILRKFRPLKSILLSNCIFNIFLSIPAVYMLYTNDSQFKQIFATIHYSLLGLFFLLSSLYVVWGRKQAMKQWIMMYLLVDNLMLNMVCVIIGFLGLFLVKTPAIWFDWINLILVPVIHFLFVGNFRLFIKWTLLQKWQITLYKISFFIGGVVYFLIGAYFMAINFKITRGYYPDIDSKLKDCALLFIFSNFGLFTTMYGVIGQIDKSQQLQYQYIIDFDAIQTQNQQLNSNSNTCENCQHCKHKNFFSNKQNLFTKIMLQSKQKNNSSMIKETVENDELMISKGIQIKLNFG